MVLSLRVRILRVRILRVGKVVAQDSLLMNVLQVLSLPPYQTLPLGPGRYLPPRCAQPASAVLLLSTEKAAKLPLPVTGRRLGA